MRTEICIVLSLLHILWVYSQGEGKTILIFFVYNENISIFVASNKMNSAFSDNRLLIDFGLVEY